MFFHHSCTSDISNCRRLILRSETFWLFNVKYSWCGFAGLQITLKVMHYTIALLIIKCKITVTLHYFLHVLNNLIILIMLFLF